MKGQTQPQSHPAAMAAVKTRASGKAILIGEHAVVYGAHAVAMPLKEMHMQAHLVATQRRTSAGEPLIRVLLQGRPVNEHLKGVVDDAFQVLGLDPYGLDLEGQSTIPIGAGLGSSASLCIVVLRALAEAAGLALPPEKLAELGNRLERRFHGNPSGLDTSVVAHEQVIGFAKSLGASPLRVSIERGRWRFALLDSGARASTLAMIQIAAPYFHGREGEGRIHSFDVESKRLMAALAASDHLAAADAMNNAAAWLSEAGVVTPALENLIVLAREHGCLAAKTTGSGGGGCVLALLSPDKADLQIQELKAKLGASQVTAVEVPT